MIDPESCSIRPFAACAAATWVDCQCPYDVGDLETRDCAFPDCQLSAIDRDAGHDPYNYAGRNFEYVPPYDADFCTCEMWWSRCPVHPGYIGLRRWKKRR